MSLPAATLEEIVGARRVDRGAARCPVPASRWNAAALAGRLVELRAAEAPALLAAALALVVDAQRRGELAAWLTAKESSFFPPDAAAAGVDLDALIVVRLASPAEIPRAADRLIRCGALGLAVLDLASAEPAAPFPEASAARLAGLARSHATAAVLLTEGRRAPCLGPLVSLCGEARRLADRRIEVRVLRDKRGAAGLRHAEPCRGPAGLR